MFPAKTRAIADRTTRHMQDCFRLHPEVYGDELADDEESEAAVNGAPETANASERIDAKKEASSPPQTPSPAAEAAAPKAAPAPAVPEKDRAVPKAAWDATSENEKAKPTPDSKPKAETPKTEAFTAQPGSK